MKITPHKIVLASLFAGLASMASAQVLSGAARGATSAAAQVPAMPPAPPPPPPPPPPAMPPPAVNASAAAQSAASATTAVRSMPTAARAASTTAASASPSGANATSPAHATTSSTTPGGKADTYAGVFPSVSASATGVEASNSTRGATTGQVNGTAFGQDTPHQAGVSVNRSGVVTRIQQATYTERGAVTSDLQGRVDISSAALSRLEARASQAGAKSRAQFAKLVVEARAREKELRASLREAAQTTKAEAWGKVQSELAKDYGAYAEVVARAETAATAGAGTP